MKTIVTLCFALFLTAFSFAQTPQLMGYQAIIRNNNNQLVVNNSVGLQVSILQGSATGSAVFVERHFPRTNTNGLISINIGAGTTVSGVFGSISWVNGPYFIKTETDLNGGSNYSISGISQLLSVPYALNAKSAETATIATTAKTAETADYTNLTNLPKLTTVATSGSFKDLTDKPSLSTVSSTGNYNDLSNKPLRVVAWGTIFNNRIFSSSGNFTFERYVGWYLIKFTNDTPCVKLTDLVTVCAAFVDKPTYVSWTTGSSCYLIIKVLDINGNAIDGSFTFSVFQ